MLALAEAFAPLLSPDQEPEALVTALRQGRQTLPDLAANLAAAADRPHGRLLIVIDQFEELYTLCPDMELQRDFLDLLLPVAPGMPVNRRAFSSVDTGTAQNSVMHAPATASRRPVAVVLTLRADFMGQALAYRPLADALQAGIVMVGRIESPTSCVRLSSSRRAAAVWDLNGVWLNALWLMWAGIRAIFLCCNFASPNCGAISVRVS